MKNKVIDLLKDSKSLIAFGVILRIAYFIINLFIGGSHIDEAMTALNAGNLVNNLTDLNGEHLPVYFDTWLYGGQSPFATYLTALSVKIFGFNLFGIRIFALVFSILGFLAFCGFVNEVFGKSRYSTVMKAFAAISPWMIFSGVYVLDCNYIGHILIIAFYFLARAVNGKGLKNYFLSMVFFGLSFYCYLASVLFVPFILLTVYLVLLFKKRIGFKELAVSVITVFIVATPFILQGMVSVGIISDFKLLGFSFSKMGYYTRNSEVLLSDGNGIAHMLLSAALNLIIGAGLTFCMTANALTVDLNTFQFATIFGALLAIIGIICVIKSAFRDKKRFSFIQKLFIIGSAVGIFCFYFFVNQPMNDVIYRYGHLSYLMIPFIGIGFMEFIDNMKKLSFKKTLAVLLSLSFVFFNIQFAVYAKQLSDSKYFVYGDAFYSSLDAAENGECVNVYTSKVYYLDRASVFIRYHYFNSDNEFLSFEDEQIKRVTGDYSTASLTRNGDFKIHYIEDKTELTEDFNIVPTDEIEMFDFGDEYNIQSFGFWSVVSK